MRGIVERLGRRSRIKDMVNQIIIIGANDIGIHLAETLGRSNQNVVLIDQSDELLQELNEEVDVLSLSGNPFDLETLKTAGVGTGTRLIAVTDSDEVNLLTLFLGESLGVEEGFALVRSREKYESFYPKVSRSGGKLHLIQLWELVSGEIEKKGQVKLRILDTDDKRGVALIAVQFFHKHPLVGKKLNQFKVGSHSRALFVYKKGSFIPFEDNYHLEAGDLVIFLMDLNEQERVIRQWFAYDGLHKVMIGGDGLIQALKSHWPTFFRGLVCIEKSLAKCQEMLKVSGHSLILRGDGLDISLLKEARIEEAGIFVSASENDEVNLLSSLLAKSFGVKDVLTILRKRQHTGMLERLSLDGIISIPQLVVEHLVQRLVPTRGGSPFGRLEVQFTREKVPGLQLVYRGGVLIPLADQKIRDDEEVLTITY